jgi:MFS family permease
MGMLVAARVAQGIGAGAIPAVAYTTVGRAYPKAVQPRLFAVFSTAWVVPGLIGPATASAIAHAASWRWVFLGLLPLVVVAAAIALPTLAVATPEATGDDTDDGRRRVLLAGVLTVGAAAVLGGLTAGSLVPAAALLVLGTPVAAWAFVRLVPAGTARAAPGMPAAVAVRGVLTFAFFGTDAFVPLALTDVRDQPGWVAGLALTVATITWTSAAWVQQRVVHDLGPRRLVRVGFLTLAVGTVGALTCLGGLPVPAAILLWGAAGFGTGLSYAPLSVTVLATARPGQEGRASAGLQLTDVLGVSLGTGLTGVFIATGESLEWTTRTSLTLAFGVTTAVALVGSVLARRLPSRI